MTSEDLRKIITPAVEYDLKAAGAWPRRSEFEPLQVSKCGMWYYNPYGSEIRPDDARAQIEDRLVEWLRTTSMEHPSIWREVAENSVDRYRITFPIGWESKDVSGPTLLHALLAAFSGRSK